MADPNEPVGNEAADDEAVQVRRQQTEAEARGRANAPPLPVAGADGNTPSNPPEAENQVDPRLSVTDRLLGKSQEPNLPLVGPNAQKAAEEIAARRGFASTPTGQQLPRYMREAAQARAAGFTWDQIDQYQNDLKDKARAAGYNEGQINAYFFGVPYDTPKPITMSASSDPAIRAQQDKLNAAGFWLHGLSDAPAGPLSPHNPFGASGLPAPGEQGGKAFTAGNLLATAGWTVADFAKTFGSTVTNAVGAVAEELDGREKSGWEHAKLAWEGAQFLMMLPLKGIGSSKTMHGDVLPPEGSGGGGRTPPPRGPITDVPTEPGPFPPPRDFFDAAVAIAQKHPEGMNDNTLSTSLRALGDNYAATGEHPVTTASNVASYDQFLTRLTNAQDRKAATMGFDYDEDHGQETGAHPWGTEGEAEFRRHFPGRSLKDLTDAELKKFEDQMIDRGEGAKPLGQEGVISDLAAEDKIIPPSTNPDDPQPIKLSDDMSKRFTELLGDEEGKINLGPRTDINPEMLFRQDPEVARGLVAALKRLISPGSLEQGAGEYISAARAQSAIETERSVHAIVRFGRAVGNLSSDMRMAYIDAIETNMMDVLRRGDTMDPLYPVQGTPMRAFADTYMKPGSPFFALANRMRKELDRRYEAMRQLGIAPDYIQGYMKHLWTDPDKFVQWVSARRPLSGGSGFTRKREFPTYREGMEAGLVPATDNPITMAAMAIRNMDNYIGTYQLVERLRAANIINSYSLKQAVPPEMVAITGRIGLRDSGQLYAPRDVAAKINSLTDVGLTNSSLYNILRYGTNTIVNTTLSLSGFHYTFVTLDTMTSQVALGTKQLSRVLLNAPSVETMQEAMRGLGTVATAPLSPFVAGYHGIQMKQYLLGQMPIDKVPPMLARISQAWIEGGGHLDLSEEFRSTAYGSYLTALTGTLRPETGYATLRQELSQQYRDAVPVKVMGTTIAPAAVRATLQLAPRILATINAPLMERYVPMMKRGVFYAMMADALRLNPEMGDLEFRHLANVRLKSIDNRLGQMVYDNRYWDKQLKDMSYLLLRAPGWNVGDFAEIGGGVYDAIRLRTETIGGKAIEGPKGRVTRALENISGNEAMEGGMRSITDRTSYLAGTAATQMAMAALIGVMFGTFSLAWGLKDYLFPPTLPDGKRRIALPGYPKEVHNFLQDPIHFGATKINPGIPMVGQAYYNRQWNGAAIYDPKEPVINNAEDYMRWLGRQTGPMAIQQQFSPNTAQQEIDPVARWFGVLPAPWAEREPEKAQKYKAREEKNAQKKRAKMEEQQ